MEHRTDAISAEERRTLDDLADLSGVQEVRVLAGGFSVAFPEADFVITMSGAVPDRTCETDWEVTVREPQPGLSTWWGTWHRSFSVQRGDAGPLIAAEVREAMTRVRSMLDDHARETQGASA